MDVVLSHGGQAVFEDDLAKSKPLVLRIDDGDGFVQLEISQSELRLTGDGGATRRSTWEVELAIPKVNER